MEFQTITRSLDRWLPADFAQNTAISTETRIRARVFIGLFFSCFTIITVSFAVFLALHLLTDKTFLEALALLGAVTTLLGLQTLMFYRLGNIGASAIIFSMFFFGVTFGVMIITGGWGSPVRQLFFCTPIISFLVGGRHEGVYMTMIVLLSGLLMLAANHVNFQPINLITDDDRDLVAGIVWIISLTILVTCLTVYDAVLQVFSKNRQRRN